MRSNVTRSRLRFTGELPTEAAIRRYPNWIAALDEEDRPGQDESTLRPHDRQDVIAEWTEHTAVQIELADGTTRLGMLSGDDTWRGPVRAERLHIFDGNERLEVKLLAGLWWPAKEASTLQYHDFQKLPLRATTKLPGENTGAPFRLALLPNGELRYGGAAGRVRFDVPPLLRVGDIVGPPVEDLRDRATASLYRIDGARRRRVGSV